MHHFFREMIQDSACSFIIQGLLSFGRHLSSGRGHSTGTLGVAKPRKDDRGPRAETRQKEVPSVKGGESLRRVAQLEEGWKIQGGQERERAGDIG